MADVRRLEHRRNVASRLVAEVRAQRLNGKDGPMRDLGLGSANFCFALHSGHRI